MCDKELHGKQRNPQLVSQQQDRLTRQQRLQRQREGFRILQEIQKQNNMNANLTQEMQTNSLNTKSRLTRQQRLVRQRDGLAILQEMQDETRYDSGYFIM